MFYTCLPVKHDNTFMLKIFVCHDFIFSTFIYLVVMIKNRHKELRCEVAEIIIN